jgi:hypothetical protein
MRRGKAYALVSGRTTSSDEHKFKAGQTLTYGENSRPLGQTVDGLWNPKRWGEDFAIVQLYPMVKYSPWTVADKAIDDVLDAAAFKEAVREQHIMKMAVGGNDGFDLERIDEVLSATLRVDEGRGKYAVDPSTKSGAYFIIRRRIVGFVPHPGDPVTIQSRNGNLKLVGILIGHNRGVHKSYVVAFLDAFLSTEWFLGSDWLERKRDVVSELQEPLMPL